MVRLSQPSAYHECDQSADPLWSEYRIRILTTALLKELAFAHRLDFLQGRLVAYITCPLIPRAYSVIMMDHGMHNLVKRFKQDITFAIPHHHAKRMRQSAIVRITLVFYKSKNYKRMSEEEVAAERSALYNQSKQVATVDAEHSPRTAHKPRSQLDTTTALAAGKASVPASRAGKAVRPLINGSISGLVDDLYTEGVRVGECQFDLMAVRETAADAAARAKGGRATREGTHEERDELEAERASELSDKTAEEMAEHEEEQTSNSKYKKEALANEQKRSKKEAAKLEQDRIRKEWQAKWLPIVSSVRLPIRYTPRSSTCLSKSKESIGLADEAEEETGGIRGPALCLNVKRYVLERHKPYRPTSTALRIFFPLFGLSVIDSTPEEACYASLSGVSCSINDSRWQTTLTAAIATMQVDNHSSHAFFPIVFNPTLLPGETVVQPLFQVALNRRKAPQLPRMLLLPYFSLLVQKMDIRVEEVIIWRTISFINLLAARFAPDLNADLDPQRLTRSFSQLMTVPPTGSQRLYLKLLHVQPLALNVSFASNPAARQVGSAAVFNPFHTFLDMLQAGIGNINDAPLRLNGKLIENAVGTTDTIVWSLVSHYIQQAVIEAYKILGSVEFLGNPVRAPAGRQQPVHS